MSFRAAGQTGCSLSSWDVGGHTTLGTWRRALGQAPREDQGAEAEALKSIRSVVARESRHRRKPGQGDRMGLGEFRNPRA